MRNYHALRAHIDKMLAEGWSSYRAKVIRDKGLPAGEYRPVEAMKDS